MKIVHFSDSHGKHDTLQIPECDVLICSGDIGGRTNMHELTAFLIWFEKQPAEKKIFIAGNHDIILDKKWANKAGDTVARMFDEQRHADAIKLINQYKVVYLNNSDHVHKGIKFWGSPYSPSFHRHYWVFNADRGQEIQKIWAKIPSDVDVLITHTPCKNILDKVDEIYREKPDEDLNVGCQDLLNVISSRLTNLKLHCSGHIHDNFGMVLKPVSNRRRVLFSNGAVLTNEYKSLVTKPLIIDL